ncbi:hypothetical protein TRIUR3_30508 [Triticum urartu]|uniref:Uncharacterized protein n=1 Tax=Triticum urartu TaxID=4572 RepID=M7XDP7_TRIUA|nr:hypothetical protein TRIUR3_30508 [Triticum urartu]
MTDVAAQLQYCLELENEDQNRGDANNNFHIMKDSSRDRDLPMMIFYIDSAVLCLTLKGLD